MNNILYILDRIYLTFAYNVAPFLISNSLKKRKGNCIKCGFCCGNCYNKSVLKESVICRNYKDRPMFCHKDFPVNKFELKYLASKRCGYYWEEKTN